MYSANLFLAKIVDEFVNDPNATKFTPCKGSVGSRHRTKIAFTREIWYNFS